MVVMLVDEATGEVKWDAMARSMAFFLQEFWFTGLDQCRLSVVGGTLALGFEGSCLLFLMALSLPCWTFSAKKTHGLLGQKTTRIAILGNTCNVWDASTGALIGNYNPGQHALIVQVDHNGVRFGGDKLRGEAFAMGQHPRLGEASRVLALELGVRQMILGRV